MYAPFINYSGGLACFVGIGMVLLFAIVPRPQRLIMPMFVLHSVIQTVLLITFWAIDGLAGNLYYAWMMFAPTATLLFVFACTIKQWQRPCEIKTDPIWPNPNIAPEDTDGVIDAG